MIFHLRKIKSVFLPEDRKTRKQSKEVNAPRQDLRLAAPAVFGNRCIIAKVTPFVKHYFPKNFVFF
jgi:hypothetical protein